MFILILVINIRYYNFWNCFKWWLDPRFFQIAYFKQSYLATQETQRFRRIGQRRRQRNVEQQEEAQEGFFEEHQEGSQERKGQQEQFEGRGCEQRKGESEEGEEDQTGTDERLMWRHNYVLFCDVILFWWRLCGVVKNLNRLRNSFLSFFYFMT